MTNFISLNKIIRNNKLHEKIIFDVKVIIKTLNESLNDISIK